MDEEQRRQEFIRDRANIGLAAQDVAESIRDILRALAAREPSAPISRAAVRLRTLVQLWRDELPVEEVLRQAVEELTNLRDEVEHRGAVIEAARSALPYIAEASSQDNFAAARASKAHAHFCGQIESIGAVNNLRRQVRDDGSE